MEISESGVSMNGGFSSTPGARMVVDNEGGSGGIFVGTPTGGEMTHIHVTDAKGKTVADYRLARGTPITSVHIVKAQFQEPLKFTFSYPTRTREVVIPFELKDIPIQK